MSHSRCPFPFTVFILHSMVSLVPYSQNNQKMSIGIFQVYDHVVTCFLHENSLYSLEYLLGALRRVTMTLWHAEQGEHQYDI
jgi:hypothetical protein